MQLINPLDPDTRSLSAWGKLASNPATPAATTAGPGQPAPSSPPALSSASALRGQASTPPLTSNPQPQPATPVLTPEPQRASGLPPAPPKAGSAFDSGHYQQTMLGLAAGFFGAGSLGEGLSNAAKTIAGQNASIAAAGRPQLGGPDNVFDVYTNPDGTHRFAPIQPGVDYLQGKRENPKDVADIHGRVMYAIGQLPAAKRQAAFADVKTHPDIYGVDPKRLPATWDDTYGGILGSMGMTVAQATSAHQAATNEDHRDGDRKIRTGIAAKRAEDAARLGGDRVALTRDALDLRKSKGPGGKMAKPAISSMSTSDLLNLIAGR